MPPTETSFSMLPALTRQVETDAGKGVPATRVDSEIDSSREEWNRLIDHTLIEWGRNPRAIEDDGIEPPSSGIVPLAIGIARTLRDANVSAPDSVVPDGSGGIVFERRVDDISEAFHIWDDGDVEYQVFDGSRLIERRRID